MTLFCHTWVTIYLKYMCLDRNKVRDLLTKQPYFPTIAHLLLFFYGLLFMLLDNESKHIPSTVPRRPLEVDVRRTK